MSSGPADLKLGGKKRGQRKREEIEGEDDRFFNEDHACKEEKVGSRSRWRMRGTIVCTSTPSPAPLQLLLVLEDTPSPSSC